MSSGVRSGSVRSSASKAGTVVGAPQTGAVGDASTGQPSAVAICTT